MRVDLQSAPDESPDTPVAEMTDQELLAAHYSRDLAAQSLREEQLQLHAETTRREHEQHRARLNPNPSLSQGVKLGK